MPIDLIIRCPKCALPPAEPFANPDTDWKCTACGSSFPPANWIELPADADQELYVDELRRNFLRDQFYE